MSFIHDQICRLCAEINKSTEDILENNLKEMAELIYRYLSITVYTFAGISTKICLDCKEKILNFHNFALKCEHAQTFLSTHKTNANNSEEYRELKSEFDLQIGIKEEKDISDIDYFDDDVESPRTSSTETKINTENDPLKKTTPSKKRKGKTKLSPRTHKSEIFLTLPIEYEKMDDNDNKEKMDDLDNIKGNRNDEITINGNVINVTKPITDIATVKEILKLSEDNEVDITKLELPPNVLQKARFSRMFNFNCHLCEMKFDEWRLLFDHTKEQHQTLPEVKCICSKTLKSWFTIKNHFRLHTPEESQNYRCDQCFKQFGRKTALKNHIITHSRGPKIYSCDQCDKKFSSPKVVKKHKKIHEPAEKRYTLKCSTCDRKFASNFCLQKHINSVHKKIKRFTCDLCGTSFALMDSLINHIQAHGDEMTIMCEKCDKRFKTKVSLRVHMSRAHRDIDSYTCPHCSKVLKTRATYKNHLHVHDEYPKFSCPYCDKKCKTKKNLDNHKKIHMGEKLYSCPWCPKTFIQPSKFRMHKVQAHEIEFRESELKMLKDEEGFVKK